MSYLLLIKTPALLLQDPVGEYLSGIQQGELNAAHKADLLWKSLLERIFEDFLRFLVPNAEQYFDFSRKFEFLNQELEQLFPPELGDYRTKAIDKLVKVYTTMGTEEWILLHIEVQGQYNRDFSKRMFRYFIRIFDKYEKPITAYAILTEPIIKMRENIFSLSCLGTELNYTFNLLKLREQDEDELRKSKNPFAWAMLIAKSVVDSKAFKPEEREEFLLAVKIKLARELVFRKMPKAKRIALLNFLKFYVNLSDKNNDLVFDQEVENLKKIKPAMNFDEVIQYLAEEKGIEKGRELGREEAKLNSQLEIALELKKEGLSNDFIAKTTKLSIEQIEKL